MHPDDYVKRYNEILDTISCFNSLQDEVLKLFCLLKLCNYQKNQHGEESLNKDYILEKVTRLLDNHPIIISRDAANLFCRLKIQKENSKGQE